MRSHQVHFMALSHILKSWQSRWLDGKEKETWEYQHKYIHHESNSKT